MRNLSFRGLKVIFPRPQSLQLLLSVVKKSFIKISPLILLTLDNSNITHYPVSTRFKIEKHRSSSICWFLLSFSNVIAKCYSKFNWEWKQVFISHYVKEEKNPETDFLLICHMLCHGAMLILLLIKCSRSVLYKGLSLVTRNTRLNGKQNLSSRNWWSTKGDYKYVNN